MFQIFTLTDLFNCLLQSQRCLTLQQLKKIYNLVLLYPPSVLPGFCPLCCFSTWEWCVLVMTAAQEPDLNLVLRYGISKHIRLNLPLPCYSAHWFLLLWVQMDVGVCRVTSHKQWRALLMPTPEALLIQTPSGKTARPLRKKKKSTEGPWRKISGSLLNLSPSFPSVNL